MNTQETILQLEELKLKGMAEFYKSMLSLPVSEWPSIDLFAARLAEAERQYRNTKKTEMYLKTSKLRYNSMLEDVYCSNERNLTISWRNKVLDMFTKLLARNNATFRNAIDIIIRFAKDTYRSIFSREETKTIKSVMEAFGKDKEDYKAVGTFLVFTANKKEPLSNSEYCKAVREVDDVAIGRYEQAQKRGSSMKL